MKTLRLRQRAVLCTMVSMPHNETNLENNVRHLSIVPPLEEVHPLPDIPKSDFLSVEPNQPVDVQLRIDNRALNLLRALGIYDQTSPADQLRMATTLYLSLRLGDKAVQEFVTKREKDLQEIYGFLEHATDSQASQE